MRAGEIEYVLYVHNKTKFCGKTWKLSGVFIPLLTIFMYLAVLVVLLLQDLLKNN